MDIAVIGLNHKSADIHFRDHVARNLSRLNFMNLAHPFSKVVLMTCNRFEVYFHSKSLTQAHSHLLREFTSSYNKHSSQKLYAFFGQDCFEHLAKVTAGLDSAHLGETEVQGQVKRAYQQALDEKTCSRELHFLFQKCLKLGKNLRQNYDHKTPDLVSTIIQLKKELFMVSLKPKILLVGASKINQQLLPRLKEYSFQVFLTNRSDEKAKYYCRKYRAKHLPWSQLDSWSDYDGIIVATKAHHHLIQKPQSVSRPKMILDLSVPRNVCQTVQEESLIKLINMDEINQIAAKQTQKHFQIDFLNNKIKGLVTRQTQIFHDKQRRTLLNR